MLPEPQQFWADKMKALKQNENDNRHTSWGCCDDEDSNIQISANVCHHRIIIHGSFCVVPSFECLSLSTDVSTVVPHSLASPQLGLFHQLDLTYLHRTKQCLTNNVCSYKNILDDTRIIATLLTSHKKNKRPYVRKAHFSIRHKSFEQNLFETWSSKKLCYLGKEFLLTSLWHFSCKNAIFQKFDHTARPIEREIHPVQCLKTPKSRVKFSNRLGLAFDLTTTCPKNVRNLIERVRKRLEPNFGTFSFFEPIAILFSECGKVDDEREHTLFHPSSRTKEKPTKKPHKRQNVMDRE